MAKRRFHFEGDDSQYIDFLENIIQTSGLIEGLVIVPRTRYESQHHELAQRRAPHNFTTKDQDLVESQALRIIHCHPSRYPKDGRLSKPRWQKELDDFIVRVPNITDLDSKTRDMGLGDNRMVISSLLNGFSFTNPTSDAVSDPISCPSILSALCKYALFTKMSSDKSRLLSCLAHFQDLIFISFCDVALGTGQSREKVHEAMRLHISDSEGHNLDKIIFGARWANRCIAKLSKSRWGLRSSELFILNGQTINFYARYAASGIKSEPYILNELVKKAQGAPDLNATEKYFVSIPCIIKLLLHNVVEYRLPTICYILGYDYESTLSCFQNFYAEFANYSTQVTNLSLSKSNIEILPETTPKRKRNESSHLAEKRSRTSSSTEYTILDMDKHLDQEHSVAQTGRFLSQMQPHNSQQADSCSLAQSLTSLPQSRGVPMKHTNGNTRDHLAQGSPVQIGLSPLIIDRIPSSTSEYHLSEPSLDVALPLIDHFTNGQAEDSVTRSQCKTTGIEDTNLLDWDRDFNPWLEWEKDVSMTFLDWERDFGLQWPQLEEAASQCNLQDT